MIICLVFYFFYYANNALVKTSVYQEMGKEMKEFDINKVIP